MKEIKLGIKARDKITGFEGIVTAKVEYINGCVQFCLTPKVEKKRSEVLIGGEYIDIQRLEYVDNGILKPKTGIGGDMRDKPKY